MLDVVLGDEAGDRLRAQGRTHVLVVRDLLSVGRSDADPALHRAARLAQWQIDDAEARAGGFDLDGVTAGEPIALWTASTWPSRLFEWHTIAQLWKRGYDLSLVSRVMPEPGNVRIASLDEDTARAAIGQWLRFCDRSPLAFDEARRAGVAAYPDLARVAEGWGAWFPRIEGGKLRLSWADQLLFDGAPRAKERAEVLMPQIGDSNIVARLNAWIAVGAMDRVNGFDGHLTALGERLRDEGAESVSAFAPMDLGGCRINDPASPWVREDGGDRWRLRAR